MKKYFYIFIFIPFLILSCDYSPIYSSKNNYNFYIEKIELSGDGRNTQGVRIIKLSGDEKVVSAIKIDDNLI